MDVPSVSVGVHDRYTPEFRDRILGKLRQASEAVDNTTYRLLSPPSLRVLGEVASPTAPVVSFYMQLGPERRIGNAWQSVFSSMVDSTLRRIGDARQRRTIQSEFNRIRSALSEELPVLGRGAAFFACGALRFWRLYAVSVPLADGVHLGHRPYIRPLVRTHDEHDRFVLAILSRELSRFFISQIGQVQEVLQVKGQRLRGILTDRVPSDRRDVVVTEAVKLAAKVLAHAVELVLFEFEGRYLLVSSPPELRAAVIDHLPKAVQSRIGGEFAVEPLADLPKVSNVAEPIQRIIEEREEVATVEQIREAGPAGSAWGESRTLDALREGRVRLLAIDDTFAKPGSRCGSCGGVWDRIPPCCPACGSEAIEATEDVVELALERALAERGAIEIVRSNKARQLMSELGRMAALLRW